MTTPLLQFVHSQIRYVLDYYGKGAIKETLQDWHLLWH